MIHRGRRLRRNSVLRSMVRENSLTVDDFIYPIFVIEGKDKKEAIPSMEGQFYYSVDRLNEEIKELVSLGINSVILFGLPNEKDECGSQAYADNGVVQRAVREIKKEFKEVLVVTDVCLCQYTSHGHCGVLENDYAKQ